MKVTSERSCNAAVERLSSPRVVDGDYDFWAGACYVTLTDGSTLPLGNHKTFEEKEVID